MYSKPFFVNKGPILLSCPRALKMYGPALAKGLLLKKKVTMDQSYSALLPKLLDQETQHLKLKKLNFIFPTLSVRNDNLLYMLAKVDQRDNTAWVIVVDMGREVVEALVPVSAKAVLHHYVVLSMRLPQVLPNC